MRSIRAGSAHYRRARHRIPQSVVYPRLQSISSTFSLAPRNLLSADKFIIFFLPRNSGFSQSAFRSFSRQIFSPFLSEIFLSPSLALACNTLFAYLEMISSRSARREAVAYTIVIWRAERPIGRSIALSTPLDPASLFRPEGETVFAISLRKETIENYRQSLCIHNENRLLIRRQPLTIVAV